MINDYKMNKIRLNNDTKKYNKTDKNIKKTNLNVDGEQKNINQNTIAHDIVIIDKIIKMFPELKKFRDDIVYEITTPKKDLKDMYVLDKVIIDNNVFYKDDNFCIVDENIKIVGVWNIENDKYFYHLFNNEQINVDPEVDLNKILAMTLE